MHLETAALEDPVVRLRVELEVPLEPFLVAVERVRVLHDELAYAEQPVARPGLVAILRLEVVEHLRQLTVRLDLGRMERKRLLVAHRQDERTPARVLQPEKDRYPDAARALPQLDRCEHGGLHLLGAERAELLADDRRDVLVHAPPERQHRPQPGAHLANEPAADEQAVRCGLGVAGSFAQGRQEER